jgi:LDH2 family malate/lactate/ureidoglycolate dehydrogenase
MEQCYSHDKLIQFAAELLSKADIPYKRALVVARTLVEADLMGHTTHGLHLLPAYVKDAAENKMKHDGDPMVINDHGSAITWDGRYLPGPWLVHEALDLAFERIREHPVVTMVIRRSHHIACLAAYPERATKQGLMMLLSSADPRTKSVAPFGGLDAVYTPNPIAAGIPTEGDPIIFDISMSTTSNGLVMRTLGEGKRLPYPWLLNNKGEATDDPSAFVDDPPATILPLGGMDSGYKGFALGLLVEALTCGLAGNGRGDNPDTWGASVFLQVIDPEAFGGRKKFEQVNQFLVNQCLRSKPIASPVRMPGTRALQLRDEQIRHGLRLYHTIPPALKSCGEKYGMALPEPMGQ